jgi:hypothetical protein
MQCHPLVQQTHWTRKSELKHSLQAQVLSALLLVSPVSSPLLLVLPAPAMQLLQLIVLPMLPLLAQMVSTWQLAVW